MTSIQHEGGYTGEHSRLIPPPESSTRTRSWKTRFLVGVFSCGVIFGRVTTFVSSPLWLDSQGDKIANVNNTFCSSRDTLLGRDLHRVDQSGNNTIENSGVRFNVSCADQKDVLSRTRIKTGSSASGQNTIKRPTISAYYIVLSQYFINTVVFGIALLGTLCLVPDKITERERLYPKWHFFIIGLSMALSSLLVNSSSSGSKTAPYLQGILMNFSVPITFIIRFLILRKRPTVRKVICAAVVVITEFVCLIPTVFPSLESKAERQTEGGAKGAARIIWPMIFVLSQVPYAIQTTVVEKVTKEQMSKVSLKQRLGKSTESLSTSPNRINMLYFLFMASAFTFMSALLLFWTQLVPYFSDVTSIKELGAQLRFNMQCEFGGSTCSGYVTLVSSICVLAHLLAEFSIANLLRWSEGASYLMVVSTIRTPLLFLFWTLFQEQPFRWFPHASLSSWLSIGAIFVMLPAVYAYSTGPPEHDPKNIELKTTAGK